MFVQSSSNNKDEHSAPSLTTKIGGEMDYKRICETRHMLYTTERALARQVTGKEEFNQIPDLFRQLMSVGLDMVRSNLSPNVNTEDHILRWKLNALAEPDGEPDDELTEYKMFRDEIYQAVDIMERLYNDKCMLEAEVEELRREKQAQ